MIDKTQRKLKAILTSKFAKFMGHTFLIIATIYFVGEMSNPYAEEHIKVANMAWFISVCVFYLDRLVMSQYQTKIEPL